MTAAEYARFMAAGRAEALAERRRRGSGDGAQGAVAATARASPVDEVWVLTSLVEGRELGEVVVPPAGMATLSGHGIMEVADNSGVNQVCLVKRVNREEVAGICKGLIGLARSAEAADEDDGYVAEDIRTMSVSAAAISKRP